MKLFLDTADIEEIRTGVRWGVLDGVTTNPTLYAKIERPTYEEVLQEICSITPGPGVGRGRRRRRRGHARPRAGTSRSSPTTSSSRSPMSENGLEAISRFAAEGIKTNCTLIFSANQGLLAAKAGASLLSPFVGRVDDTNEEGMIVIRELVGDRRLLRPRRRGPRRVDPRPAPHHRLGARRRAHRDAPVQGPAADGPPPADRHRDRQVQAGLGVRPRLDGRQGLTPAAGPRRPRGRAPRHPAGTRGRTSIEASTTPPRLRRDGRAAAARVFQIVDDVAGGGYAPCIPTGRARRHPDSARVNGPWRDFIVPRRPPPVSNSTP